MDAGLPKLLEELSFEGLERIDVALEGNWSATVTTVWTTKEGFCGFSSVIKSHAVFRPSIELYFNDSWVGIRCFRRVSGVNVFDEDLALRIIHYVEANKRMEGLKPL